MKKLFVFIILSFTSLSGFASHIIGYDFSYVCLGNNTYEFTLAVYRDCRPESAGGGQPGAIQEDAPAIVRIFKGNQTIKTSRISSVSTDIVPPEFSNNCLTNPPIRCISRVTFVFREQLLPSPAGYTLVYQRCCRNGSTLNIRDAGNTGNSFVCTIPPNDNCNNSAKFKVVPPQIICINNPWSFDCSAVDADGDSLSYEFCPGIKGGAPSDPKPENPAPPPYTEISYLSPYSALYPLSSSPALSINPRTGIITGTPNLQGIYAISICCKEWRNGVLINTVRREFQVNVTNCSKAVVADIPVLSQEPNTYLINCKDLTVNFRNDSKGGFAYEWDFGVAGITTDVSTAANPTYTYPDTGTYIVKLVVNPGSTCPDSIERIVKVYPTFTANYSYSGLFCPDVPISFLDLSSSTHYPVNYWQWNFDDGTTGSVPNINHAFPNIGKEFNVQLISGNEIGCRDTTTQKLNIPLVKLDAGNDTIILRDEPIQFNATGTQSYSWIPNSFINNPNINNPVGQYPNPGIYPYFVTGITADGCPASDSIIVTVSTKPYVYLPNAFSPNGDGNNDILRLITSGFTKINSFKIYNRWGQQVFETNNYYQGWDGTFKGEEQPIGTYYWLVNINDLEGQEKLYRGDVILIR